MVKSFNEMVDRLSERKELEEKLKKTEQLSVIGQLASGIAHEVRNPLNFLSLSIGHIKERILEEKISGSDDITMLLDDLKKAQKVIKFGGTRGSAVSIIGCSFMEIAGLRGQVIQGFGGSSGEALAAMRGELDGFGNSGSSAVKFAEQKSFSSLSHFQ
jgi:signal transduction histidine kinase